MHDPRSVSGSVVQEYSVVFSQRSEARLAVLLNGTALLGRQLAVQLASDAKKKNSEEGRKTLQIEKKDVSSLTTPERALNHHDHDHDDQKTPFSDPKDKSKFITSLVRLFFYYWLFCFHLFKTKTVLWSDKCSISRRSRKIYLHWQY